MTDTNLMAVKETSE